MKIALGADDCGFPLKEIIKEHLVGKAYTVQDVGVQSAEDTTPYYAIASQVAQSVTNKTCDCAILVCGTGMGMAIIANKHPGIYAAVCESTYTAEQSRSINNANILTLGAMVSTGPVAIGMVDVWLKTEFTQGCDAPAQDWLRNSMKDIASLETSLFP